MTVGIRALALTPILAFATCSTPVHLVPEAERIEFVDHAYLRTERARRCKEVGQFEVVATPKEVSGEEELSVLQIKAMNAARQHDATHVLLFPAREFACEEDGTPSAGSEKICHEQKATGYQCLVGYGT